MNSFLEGVYRHGPVGLQNLMTTAYGWKLKKLRYGGNFETYVEELEASQWLSEAEFKTFQDENLTRLIRHCYDNVPYYSQLFRELRLTPDDFRSAADLGKLPTLKKESVRRDQRLFYARNYEHQPCEVVGTSGTTGATLRIRVDLEGRRKNYAFFARFKQWSGVTPSAKSATLGGRPIVPPETKSPPFWRYNYASRNLLFSSYHLAQANMAAYLAKLLEWNPDLIESYPSSLQILADFILERDQSGPKPRAIITSSETLQPWHRYVIEKAFRAKVFDQYGSAEQVCFVAQCEAGEYHVNPEFGITEFMPGTDGESRIVATGFTNYAMPLLRYETGDNAIPSVRKCYCGRNFPVVEQILGRADDIITTPDGRRIGRLDPVFKGLETIRRAQIVQKEINRIEINLVPGIGFLAQHADSIRHELELRIGSDMNFQFNIVDEIPVGAGGKFRSVISQIPRPVARSHVTGG